MDSPSLDSPRPCFLSDRQSEPGDVCPSVGGAGRATREGTVLVATFGNPIAVDFAAFVSQNSQSDAVCRRRGENPSICGGARTFSTTERVLTVSTEIGSNNDQVDSLILFLNSPLTTHDRRGLDES